ncbi:MAG: hypothetical protein KKE44_20245 [Proteobacteria bacterium]|nr:hypothetical protein [Pseudomonadota bacterium]MBU1585063.1 hypothetical protein [Pseudomonadota bacterium]MBU2455872.1 hypothetical protein [Pseudomonadota bacterium]MBU2629562.1 hypothetical protein [Pseudomonadota bacterium]
MVRLFKILITITGIFCFLVQPAFGNSQVLTDVKVIHASTGSQHVDPGLNPIISELQSVFKYTAYRLLNDQQLNLRFNQKGRVTLPGERTLTVMPSDMDGKRIRYQIEIQKNNQPIFQTQVLLRNNSSITIGGPQFNNGVLLFNISGSVH